MKKFPVILDLETKFTFRQYSDPKKLGVSIVAIFDYRDNQPKIFFEKELLKLFPLLENASYLIGYNIKSFDIAVLQGYYPGEVENFSSFDILDDVKEKIGHRLALNDIIFATLGKRKSGHGLLAIEYYKQGEWEKLKKYCLDDVMLTKELFEYGAKNGYIFYLNEKGKVKVKVDWERYLQPIEGNEMPLTLPF